MGQKSTQPKPLGKRLERLHAALRDGATLCCEIDSTEEGLRNQGRRWFLEPGGAPVGPATALQLVLREDLVEPTSPGLFHRNDSQTYRAVQS